MNTEHSQQSSIVLSGKDHVTTEILYITGGLCPNGLPFPPQMGNAYYISQMDRFFSNLVRDISTLAWESAHPIGFFSPPHPNTCPVRWTLLGNWSVGKFLHHKQFSLLAWI